MRKYGKLLLVLGILAGSPGVASADGFPGSVRSQSAVQERNQRKAEEVGKALTAARVNGYDLGVEVRGNAVKLEGKVRDVTHKALAERVCRRVEGIDQVVNNLKYVPSGQIQQTAGVVSDNALRPAVYSTETEATGDGIEQVHFQKPGKTNRKPKQSSSGNAFTRFFSKTRHSTPQPRRSTTQPRQTTGSQTANRTPQTNRQSQQLTRQQPQQPQSQQPQRTASLPQQKVTRTPEPKLQPKPQPTPLATAAPQQQQSAPKYTARPETLPTVSEQPSEKPVQVRERPVQPVAAPAFEPQRPVQKQVQLPAEPAVRNNQDVAQEIGLALAKVGLVGYDVVVRYENGIATLDGEVATIDQMRRADFAASQIRGVEDVQNNLQIKGPIAQTSFGPRPDGNVRPVAMAMPMPMMAPGMMPGGAPGMMPGMMPGMAPGMMPGMQPGMMPGGAPGMGQGGYPTPVGAAGNYSNPNLPSHAWPAYAAYPNSAAITYPKQYSASAWPYIGPFYPYPQVPMGWREVSLQWDDGHWQLDFEKKHNAWYWLWNPKNWQ